MIGRRAPLVWLAVAAAAVVAAGLVVTRSREGGDPAAGRPVLEELQAALNDVTEVRITRGDGSRATLRRRSSDWVVVERDFPADSGKVRKLLLDLAALEVVEEKTGDPGSYARIGVQDVNGEAATGTRIEAVTPAGTFAVISGKSSGANSAFVRVVGAKPSYLATPRIAADADPKRWIERTVVDVSSDRVQEAVVTPAEGRAYTVSRENKDRENFAVDPIPKGRELSYPAVANGLAEQLESFAVEDVSRRPPDAKPAASVTVRTFDGLELVFDGRKDGERHYLTVSARSTADTASAEAQKIAARAQGRQFEIPAYRYDALFRPLEELLKP
jgi:hypothetical protein